MLRNGASSTRNWRSSGLPARFILCSAESSSGLNLLRCGGVHGPRVAVATHSFGMRGYSRLPEAVLVSSQPYVRLVLHFAPMKVVVTLLLRTAQQCLASVRTKRE